MNKYEKALDDLQDYHDHYHDDVSFENYQLLKELVEKATPKKPVKYILGYFSEDDSREKDVYVDCCPNCDEIVDKEFCYMEYCPHCGQMLLWEGEEDE